MQLKMQLSSTNFILTRTYALLKLVEVAQVLRVPRLMVDGINIVYGMKLLERLRSYSAAVAAVQAALLERLARLPNSGTSYYSYEDSHFHVSGLERKLYMVHAAMPHGPQGMKFDGNLRLPTIVDMTDCVLAVLPGNSV